MFSVNARLGVLLSGSCSRVQNMRTWRKSVSVFLFMMVQAIFGVSAAHADNPTCNATAVPNYSPMLAPTTFPRDAPVGSATQSYAATLSFHCQGDTDADRDIYVTFAATPATVVSGYTNVYETNVQGVGVRYTVSNEAGTACVSLPATVDNGSAVIRCHQLLAPTDPGYNYSVSVSAQFVKTANATIGTLTTIPVLTATNTLNNESVNTLWGNVFSGSASGTFASQACRVTTPAVQVTMPQARTKDLPSVGSTTGSTPLNVSLDCDAGVSVYATLSDVTMPSNTSTTLNLTTDSTAQGIGYEIVYAEAPVAFGVDSAMAGNANQFAVTAGQTVGGVVNVPLTARYVRTGVIRAGSANAKATFTMSYQ
ncbi:type 1 fimbrial protein [Paraburkholderia dipogonis]|uniref:Type 1 fimbrial protein n=2 Tax=Paraburkholderia dipogonis TaxID=1211383 RepID=A0A4Y8MS39_9BURK|nr:type 1 fimbrial protein [Paraburkholderia dipogonis]